MAFDYDDGVVDQIAARCTEVESGARNVDHIITGRSRSPAISRELLGRMAEGEALRRLQVSVAEDSKYAFEK